MKYFVLLLFAGIGFTASAQTSRSVTKSIHDDGNTLYLKYEVTGSGKHISYNNEFNVKGWTKKERNELVSRVVDSLENASGEQKDYMRKTINDDGQTLSISIVGKTKGRAISYNKDFDVKGKSQQEKNAIIDDVMKSLGLTDKKD